jgi:hypothetical protein
MAAKWVDNTGYFGPDRRKPGRKRLLDRRRFDESGQPPPVAAMLRRARVRINGPSEDDRRHALEILKGAIEQANRLGWARCATAVIEADRALRSGRADAVSTADDKVAEALGHAGIGR